MFLIKNLTKESYFKNNESSVKMFQQTIKKVNFCGSLIGCNIHTPNYTIHCVLFYILMLDLFTYLSINFYNVYLFRNDFVLSTFCLVTLGMGFQGAIKLYVFIFHRFDMLKICSRIEKIHKSATNEKIKNVLEQNVIYTCIAGSILIPLYSMSGVLMFIYPIIYYMVFGEKILHFGFLLPFIDWQSHLGYSLNFMHHTLQICIVMSAWLFTNWQYVIFITNAFGQYDSLKILLHELNDLSTANVNGCNDREIKKYINDIAKMHIELISFLSFMENMFIYYYLIEIGSLVFQVTVTLFAVVSVTFIPGYVILVIDVFQLFVPCLVGTVLVVKGDEFYADICKLTWNSMSLRDQKSINIMLCFAKKSKTVSFVSCSEQNMFTFKKPSKSFFFKANERADEMYTKSLESSVRRYSRIIGCDIFDEAFTSNKPIFYLLFMDMISFFTISFYNIYLFRDDFIRSTFCVLTLGMGFQGAIKLYTFVFHRSDLIKVNEIVVQFQQSAKSPKIKDALELSVVNSCTAGLVLTPMYITSGILMFSYPIVYYLFFGEKILHFGFIIPGIDEESYFGYSLNFVYDSLQIFLIINATIASNIGFIMFINCTFGQYDVLKVLLQELDTLSIHNDKGCNDHLIKQYIKKISSIHVELIK
ncbi:unnamed protein product [Diamesa serratosioi]